MADVKMEGTESFIKPDPDSSGPAPAMDDDDYEDTGELEFSKEQLHAWLTRVPRVLWEQWSKLDDDDEIQVGNIRHFKDSNTYKLILNPDIPQQATLPREFDMRLVDANSRNTYVFSEKDLPGYKGKSRMLPVREDANSQKGGKPKRMGMRTIPKQTALTATVSQEMHCVASEDQEYGNLFKARIDEEARARQGIKFLDDEVGKTSAMVLQSSIGAGSSSTGFKQFITPAGTKPSKAKSDNKTARIPQNQLLDTLYDKFKQYRYWPLKALKAETRQPETYLKETLLMIADLVKSGPFALTYKLKPEADMGMLDLDAKDEIAPNEENSDMDEGGDDEDLEMEDVL